MAEHVWEHLTYQEGIKAAKICFEFLEPRGYVRCAVPDGFFQDEDYQKGVQVGGLGPADHPAASHKIVLNYKTITSMFESAGFEVNLLEYCDELCLLSLMLKSHCKSDRRIVLHSHLSVFLA